LPKSYVINGLNKETIRHLKNMVKDKKCTESNLVGVVGCEGGIGGNATVCAPRIANKAIKPLAEQSKDVLIIVS
jgi:hypothetical protein